MNAGVVPSDVQPDGVIPFAVPCARSAPVLMCSVNADASVIRKRVAPRSRAQLSEPKVSGNVAPVGGTERSSTLMMLLLFLLGFAIGGYVF